VIRRFRWAAAGAVTAAALIVAAAVSLEVPYQGFSGETFVRVEHGAGTPSLARTLQDAGVIRYAWQFWLERALRPSAKLQAGEYRFAEAASVSGVYGRIARGDVYYFEVNVPEGSNMFDIAHLLETSGVMPASDFLRAAQDPSLIRDLDPKAPTLEGYLFPATYRLSHSTTAEQLCRMMTAEFRREWKKLAAGDPSSPHQVVTLASLVEKETGLAAERPVVAGVFVHRLKLGMLLDCDPTTIYASLLDRRYRGAIHQSDLDNPDPYNTYKNAGLPPGPIANPGADSIRAALHPAETDFLYFVAKPSGGGHQFSTTLAAHEKAVQKYRHGTKPATKTSRRAKKKKR
jgi:peptidoglycan lytic transglycosylase G